MSDVKALVDEYAAENAQLRGLVAELGAALQLAAAYRGTIRSGGKFSGQLVYEVPAAARRLARRVTNMEVEWPAGRDRGPVRVRAILGAASPDGETAPPAGRKRRRR